MLRNYRAREPGTSHHACGTYAILYCVSYPLWLEHLEGRVKEFIFYPFWGCFTLIPS